MRRCPTGALHYRRRTGAAESPPARTEARPAPDGPLYVHGRLRVRLPDGETKVETRVALCRCGASANKPYCDGAHGDAGFVDAAPNVPPRLAAGTSEDAALDVSFAPDGPILVNGPVTVCGADASEDDRHAGRALPLRRLGDETVLRRGATAPPGSRPTEQPPQRAELALGPCHHQSRLFLL